MSGLSKVAQGRWWRDAPALRFLALFLVGWMGLRMAVPFAGLLWADAILARQQGGEDKPRVPALTTVHSSLPTGVPPAMLAARRAFMAVAKAKAKESDARADIGRARRGDAGPVIRTAVAGPVLGLVDGPAMAAVYEAPAEAAWAAASVASVDRPAALAVAGVRQDGVRGVVGAVASDSGRGAAGWSLSTWLFLQDNLAQSSENLPVAGELGGSQAGLRLAYALDDRARVDIYGRMSAALGHVQQSEAAFGVSVAPLAAVPIRAAVERREKIGRDGRSAMAAMLVGGVSGKALPADFRLDVYAQAGVVGLNSRDAFVDGAVVIDRAVRRSREAGSLRFGAVAAGAAQPDVARVDVGPRITQPLPQLGKGARLSVDWRQRVAGNAQPQNGASLTFGADF